MKTASLLLLLALLTAGAVSGQEETEPATTEAVPTATFYASIEEAAEATCLPWYNFWDDPNPIVVEFYTDW